MMLEENKLVQSLWIGRSLSLMEQLSINSFLRHGHMFHLYTYNPVDGVPEGVIIKDANEIIHLDSLDYKRFPKLALFSDFFRYKLLWERGGWWVDTDTICLRPFDFSSEYVFSSEATKEGSAHTNNGNIKVPKGSPIMGYCWHKCLEMKIDGEQWLPCGPSLIQSAVKVFELQKHVKPPQIFCPVPWWEANKFSTPNAQLDVIPESHAVHLWGTMWEANQCNKNMVVAGSPYENLISEKSLLDDTTAIIKTLMRDESLFHCVRTLKQHYPSIHVIVADDGHCTDEKESKLKDLGVEKYLRMSWNQGLSAGRNVLIDACETPYILLCDDDFSFTENSHIERLRKLMDISDIAAGIVFNVRNWTGCPDGAGWDAVGGRLVQQNNKFYRTGFSGDIKEYCGIHYEVADLVLNFFVARTDILRKVRWDDAIAHAFEHWDFFIRARESGVRTVRTTDAQVLHKELDDTSNPEYMQIRSNHGKYRQAFERKWGFSPWLDVFPGSLPSPQITVPYPVPLKVGSFPPRVLHHTPPITGSAPIWNNELLEKKISQLKRLGFDVIVFNLESPILDKFRGFYPNAIEELVESPSGPKILFCVQPLSK